MESLDEQCLGCSDLCLNPAQQAADCGCAALGSQISQLSTALFQLTEQREALSCARSSQVQNPPWHSSCAVLGGADTAACGQIMANHIVFPKPGGKNVKLCNSRPSQHHLKRISPVQTQAWGGGGLLRAVSWLWQGCCHGLACATPPPTPAESPGWLLSGIWGKKALREVYQAITLLLCRALSNKYLQKSIGSSAPSLTSEAELSLVLFPVVGELGGCRWSPVTFARQLIFTTHPSVHPFFTSDGMFLGSRPHGKHL